MDCEHRRITLEGICDWCSEPVEAVKVMSELPLPWNSVYTPPAHIVKASKLIKDYTS